jgi:hypothetical protein
MLRHEMPRCAAPILGLALTVPTAVLTALIRLLPRSPASRRDTDSVLLSPRAWVMVVRMRAASAPTGPRTCRPPVSRTARPPGASDPRQRLFYDISTLGQTTGSASFAVSPITNLAATPQGVIGAADVAGITIATWDPIIEVTVPPSAAARTYTATITHSVS